MSKLIGYQDPNIIGGLVPILSQTVSSGTASVSFDIPITYDAYSWRFYNIHPASTTYANGRLSFQVNATDGADFNDSLMMTTTWVQYHEEDAGSAVTTIYDSDDEANLANFQKIGSCVGTEADSGISGWLTMYGTNSGTFVKHFIAQTSGNTDNTAGGNDQVQHRFTAGYVNDTTIIDEINFKFVSDNIDSGIFSMYGVI